MESKRQTPAHLLGELEPSKQDGLPKVMRLDPVQTDAAGMNSVSFNPDMKAVSLYQTLIANGIKQGNETRAMQLAASMLLAVFIFMADRFGVDATQKTINDFVQKFVDRVNESHKVPTGGKEN